MPSPDIRRYLDEAVSTCSIGGDVYGFMMELDPQAAGAIDALPPRPIGHRLPGVTFKGFRRAWNNMQDDGELLEARYLAWRRKGLPEITIAALSASNEICEQVGSLVETHASRLVDDGFTRYDDAARAYLRGRFGFDRQMAVLKRSARRAHHDLNGYAKDVCDEAIRMSNEIYNRPESALERQIEESLAFLPAADRGETDPAKIRLPSNPKHAQRYIKRGTERHRRAVVRAIKFAQRLISPEQVRLFVGGDKLRITGQHAIYELRKTGHMGQSHGAAELCVFTKEGDIELCNLCIFTPGVPLMDHVGSVILHIRSGAEEEILRIGNAYNVKPPAYEQPWLVPHLPPPPQGTPDLNAVLAGRVWAPRRRKEPLPVPRFPEETKRVAALHEQERAGLIVQMNNPILDQVLDAFGQYLPEMETTMSLLRTGHFPDWTPMAQRLANPEQELIAA